ncbi:MAG: SDR family NAD(P)-dependent oxidoreductase [Chryseobacterium sp.]|nr:SDR family NAD(P)-dependent oxidoreductase [Candidatus Chryseobacterium enterohippi]
MSNHETKKTAVITGASSGVGLATAEAFAKAGYNIVIAARGNEGLERAAARCIALGADVLSIPTDMSKADEVQALVNKSIVKFGEIDVWVNNAGVMASGKFEEIPMDICEQVIETNLMGYMHGAYYILPIFKNQNRGIIINNVSIAGFMPAPYSAIYTATKHGIRGMMNGIQGEISNFPHIHICNIYPQVQRSTGNSHSAKYSGLDFKVPPFAADPKDTAALILKLAKSPKKDNFPDATSFLLNSVYTVLPRLITNATSMSMRVMMKLKNGEPTEGNVLKPSQDPHQIYGETSLPVPSKSTKNIVSAALVVGVGLLVLKAFGNSKSSV